MNRQYIATVLSSFFLLCFFAWIVGYAAVVLFGFDIWLIAPLIGFYFLAWLTNVVSGSHDGKEIGAATAEDLETERNG